VNVGQPNFIRRAAELVNSVPLEDWRAYLRYHLISAAAPWLSSDFATENFTYQSLYSGAKEMLPRWKRCLRVTDDELGEALGQANVFRANVFEWQRVINRPGKPVDKTEWDITVPTVNAYYDPSVNEMVFPAGALLPQTFDASGDMAANYGSLGGSWAGHELTHGFDDEGRHYDAEGNLRDWWAGSDSVAFNAQAQKVVDQFTGYIQVDTLHVNGKLTLGENIADYGGLVTAVVNEPTSLDIRRSRGFSSRSLNRGESTRDQSSSRRASPSIPTPQRSGARTDLFRTCQRSRKHSIASRAIRWCVHLRAYLRSGRISRLSGRAGMMLRGS
jgi:predicted metalloendopeptidase